MFPRREFQQDRFCVFKLPAENLYRIFRRGGLFVGAGPFAGYEKPTVLYKRQGQFAENIKSCDGSRCRAGKSLPEFASSGVFGSRAEFLYLSQISFCIDRRKSAFSRCCQGSDMNIPSRKRKRSVGNPPPQPISIMRLPSMNSAAVREST